MLKRITMFELEEKLNNNETLNILDVREQYEYANGHIKGSVNMPVSQFMINLKNLDKSKEYHVLCLSGDRANMVCNFLNQQGYNVVSVAGGMYSYQGELDYEL